MEDIATPSINAQLMAQYVGSRVRLVCELDGVGNGQTLTARTSDKGTITVVKDPRAGLPTTRFVEFIGTVADPCTLREESNSNWGENFDLAMHNDAVLLMNGDRYSSLFK